MHDFAKHFKSDLHSIQFNDEVSAGDTLLVYNPFSDTVTMFEVEYPDKLSLSDILEYYRVSTNSDELEVGSYVLGTDGKFYMRIMDSEGNPVWLGACCGQEVYSKKVNIKEVLYEGGSV